MAVLPDLLISVNDAGLPAFDNGRFDVATYGNTDSALPVAVNYDRVISSVHEFFEEVEVLTPSGSVAANLILDVFDNALSQYDLAGYDNSSYNADDEFSATFLPFTVTHHKEVVKDIGMLLEVDDPNTAGNVLELNSGEVLNITDLENNIAKYGTAQYNIDSYSDYNDVIACVLQVTKQFYEAMATDLLVSVIANYDYSLYNENMESATPSADNYERVRDHGTSISLYYTHYPEIETDGRVNFQSETDDVSFGWAFTDDLNQRNREVLRKQE